MGRPPARAWGITLSLVLVACSDATAPAEDFPPYPSQRYLVENYGGGFRLSVFEAPGDHPVDSAGAYGWWRGVREPRPVLVLKTFSERDSCWRWIEVETRREDAVIELRVGRTFAWTGACTSPGIKPAVWSEFVELPEGESTLRIDVLGYVQEFRIRVSEAAIELSRVTPVLPSVVLGHAVIQPEFSTFWRFPPRSFLLYCEGDGCEAIEGALVRELDLTPHTFPVGGHLPFPLIQDDPASGRHRYFRMAAAGDFTRVRGRLCALAPRGSGTAAYALSWRNEETYSFGC